MVVSRRGKHTDKPAGGTPRIGKNNVDIGIIQGGAGPVKPAGRQGPAGNVAERIVPGQIPDQLANIPETQDTPEKTSQHSRPHKKDSECLHCVLLYAAWKSLPNIDNYISLYYDSQVYMTKEWPRHRIYNGAFPPGGGNRAIRSNLSASPKVFPLLSLARPLSGTTVTKPEYQPHTGVQNPGVVKKPTEFLNKSNVTKSPLPIFARER
jgi:hypothetical protein